MLELVERPELGGGQQRVCHFGRAGLKLGLGGGERPRCATCGLGGQLGSSLQESGSRRDAATALRPTG